MKDLARAKIMMIVVAAGLFVSGVTVWPAVIELKLFIHLGWGNGQPDNELYQFLIKTIHSLDEVKKQYPFLLYAHDWLAFAHIMLAILFTGAARDPVRNKWIVQCGLIM